MPAMGGLGARAGMLEATVTRAPRAWSRRSLCWMKVSGGH
jgi:hypothetical protein